MTDKKIEIIVSYNSWNVEIYNGDLNLLNKLTCKPNGWFSNNISGSTEIGQHIFSVINDKNGISLRLNNSEIGKTAIVRNDRFGRFANIDLLGGHYKLMRENLQQLFTVVDGKGETIMRIEGKLDKRKQVNFFGLIFFPKNLYHSVVLTNDFIDKTKLLYLLTICGYCIRVFLQVDMGEYYGQVSHEDQTSR